MKITAIIVAAGSGRRMGATENKVFLWLAGRSVIAYTIEAFERCERIDDIIIVTRKCDIPLFHGLATSKVRCVTEGGAERQQSVLRGLRRVEGDKNDIVLIHDGARPFVDDTIINAVIDDCMQYGGAAAGVPCKDTLKIVDDKQMIVSTADREKTYQIQTPQAFHLYDIISAHEQAAAEGVTVTDDCALAEHYGTPVKVTMGSYDNIKLTTPEDMAVGEKILQRRQLCE